MAHSEHEPAFPSDDLCSKIETLFSGNLGLHPEVKPFISSAEISSAAERIANFVSSLVSQYPIEHRWSLSLFRDMVEVSFQVPDENGVISYTASSQADQSRCHSYLEPLSSSDPARDHMDAAQAIIGTVIACVRSQLDISYKKIMAGSDQDFDLIFVKLLGGKEALLKVFSDWYAYTSGSSTLQHFGQLGIVLEKKTRRSYAPAQAPLEKAAFLVRTLVADAVFGLETHLKITSTSPELMSVLSASFEPFSPEHFGRSAVESGKMKADEKAVTCSSSSPGSRDLENLPENMMYFLRLLFEHLTRYELWAEFEEKESQGG